MLKGYKTILANTLMLLPLAFELGMQILVSPEFGDVVPDQYKGLYGIAIIFANYWLRVATTTPIGRSR